MTVGFLSWLVSSGQLILYKPDVSVDIKNEAFGCYGNRISPQPGTYVLIDYLTHQGIEHRLKEG